MLPNSFVVPPLFVAIALIAVLSCGNLSSAEEPPIELRLRPHWKVGDSRKYVIHKVKVQTRQGVKKRTSAHTDLAVEVLSVNAEGYRLRWTTSNLRPDPGKLDEDPAVKEAIARLANTTVVVQLDQDGRFQGVEDWRELKKQMEDGVALIKKEVRKKAGHSALLDKIFKDVLDAYSTEEVVTRLFAKEFDRLFCGLGLDLRVHEPLESDTETQLPLLGINVKCHHVLDLRSFDPKSQIAVIRYQRITPVDEFTDEVFRVAQAVAARSGQPAPDRNTFKGMRIEDVEENRVNVRTGWPEQTRYKTVSQTNGEGNGELVTISRITDDLK